MLKTLYEKTITKRYSIQPKLAHPTIEIVRFGIYLRMKRKEKKINLEDIAQRLKIDKTVLSRIERGTRIDEEDSDTLISLQGFNPNFTTLTQIQSFIDDSETKRQILVSDLIRYYINGDSIYQAIELLRNENSLERKHALIGTYIKINELDSAESLLSTLPQISSEDSAYFDLYSIYIDLQRDDKTIWDLDSIQKARVSEIANMCPVSLATGNAQIALALVYGMVFDTCEVDEEYRLANNFFIDNRKLYYNIENLGNAYPNPFSGVTYIPYNIPTGSHAVLNIYSVNGTIIKQHTLTEGTGFVQIDLSGYSTGMYLCYLNIDDGRIIKQKKLLLNK